MLRRREALLASTRRVLATSAMALVLSTCSATPDGRPVATPTVEPGNRPNILVLMADDMRQADLRYLPRTRRILARNGVSFTQMISQHPLCCPARAEFLTGQLAQNNGVRANNASAYGGYGRLNREHTLATWLHDAGYRTGFIGKHLNGYSWRRDGADPGWDIFSPLSKGTYRYFGFTMVQAGRTVTNRRDYVTDHIAERADLAIRRLSRTESPFFLWVAHVAPHLVYHPAQQAWGPPLSIPPYADRFRTTPLDSRSKPSFNEPDVTDKPALLRIDAPSPQDLVRLHRARVRALRALDDAQARTLRGLERIGELDDTFVFFTSDNGYLLGEHRWTEKTLGYEESLQVPLLVRGFPPGSAPRRSARSSTSPRRSSTSPEPTLT